MASGQLERLVIHSYGEPDYSGKLNGTFEAYVNPAEITVAYEIEYDAAQGAGSTGSRMDFKRVKPGDLALSFFLDGTGANGRPIDVQAKVDEFQLVTGFRGELHRPSWLKIAWGSMPVCRCVLKSASIAYKLFRPDGSPLRAVISASFVASSDDKTRTAREDVSSPDLTHVRVFKAGDTLPGLCREIYGDPHHYVSVGRANGFDSFRDVPEGTRVRFPPVEK